MQAHRLADHANFSINAEIFLATIRQVSDTLVVVKDFITPIWIFEIIVPPIIRVNGGIGTGDV